MVQLGWGGLKCQLIVSIVSTVFVLLDEIDYVDCINRINFTYPGILNCNALQLKDDANDSTNSGINLWGKKGELFNITGIY